MIKSKAIINQGLEMSVINQSLGPLTRHREANEPKAWYQVPV